MSCVDLPILFYGILTILVWLIFIINLWSHYPNLLKRKLKPKSRPWQMLQRWRVAEVRPQRPSAEPVLWAPADVASWVGVNSWQTAYWARHRVYPVHAMVQFSSVQSLSHVRLFVTPWIAAHQASLSITNSQSSLRLTSNESVMPSSHLILCRPLLLLSPIPPSINLFQWVNSLHEVARVLEFDLQDHSLQRTTRADLLQYYLNSNTEMISHEVFLVKWNDRCESLSRVPAF